MPRISAVIIARNEEANIRYCLDTLRWCDEIILVDMESQDRTVAIAREYTDKIHTHPVIPNFDEARKSAVEKATGDWILIVDADEMIPKGLSDKLRAITCDNYADVVYMPFKTHIMGVWIKHACWWPDYHPRLFRRGMIDFTDTLHSYMAVSPSARVLRLAALEEDAVEHFAYADSADFVSKLNRYTSIEAQRLSETGKAFSVARMCGAATREFLLRYIIGGGLRDGHRGFFLSIMMAFYRALVHVKLWEKQNTPGCPVNDKYREAKNRLISQYRKP